LTEGRSRIPPSPAWRAPGHAQVSQRLRQSPAHCDLVAEMELLRGEPAYARAGRNAKTLVKRSDFRVVLTAIRAGTRIARHQAPGPVTVQALSGRIRLHLGERQVELVAGHLLSLEPGEPHDVEALEDGAFLLTIAWPERR
jgi:quercetin dioxygenase-like cupin family protein